MKPQHLSAELNRIATGIDKSNNPSRQLVLRDLRRVLASLDPEGMGGMGVTSESMHEAAPSKAGLAAALAAAGLTGVAANNVNENLRALKSIYGDQEMGVKMLQTDLNNEFSNEYENVLEGAKKFHDQFGLSWGTSAALSSVVEGLHFQPSDGGGLAVNAGSDIGELHIIGDGL